MRWIITIMIALISLLGAQSGLKKAAVIRAAKMDKSKPLVEILKGYTPNPTPSPPQMRPFKQPEYLKNVNSEDPQFMDPVWQSANGNIAGTRALQNFDGLGSADNRSVLGGSVAPPDPDFSVGPDHVVQMVNLVFSIWDKEGNQLVPPAPSNMIWQGFGGPCEVDNDGDPIVLYDHLADRWVLSQFAVSTGNCECIAVSETPDPTGAYYRYKFDMGDFPDYPKLSVWPNAYYATFRQFGASFTMLAAALEREKMLAGDPDARIITYSLTEAMGQFIDGFLPVDLDGPPPSSALAGIFMGFQDDASTPGLSEDRLVIFEMSPDWDQPDNSTLSDPLFLETEPFSSNFCGSIFGGSCVPQPTPGENLDVLSGFLMNRAAFRNFGTHFSIVANHTVDVGDFQDHAGIRWYELRKSRNQDWSIYQQSTYAPDSDHRWLGSIGMDADGNIGLMYSVSGENTFPSIRYTGRPPEAPPGEMIVVEQSLIEGGGAQVNSFGRWGDYAKITTDPSDDRTFWMNHEYYAQTSSFNWRTRIGSFNFDGLRGPASHLQFTAYSDFRTPNSIMLSWINPESAQNGDPLPSESYATIILRDGIPIDSVAGGIETYTDTGLEDGIEYFFGIYAINTAEDLAGPTVEAAWIAGGAKTPESVQDLRIGGTRAAVKLFWTNPQQNIDGTPMDDLGGINLYQDEQLVMTFERTPADSGVADSLVFSPEVPGLSSWSISVSDNETPANESEISDSLVSTLAIDILDPFAAFGEPDSEIWLSEKAEINNRALDPPSGPAALNLNGTGLPIGPDQIELYPVDLMNQEGNGIVFAFQYQPGGQGDPVETNDRLQLFFRDHLDIWQLVKEYNGTDVMPFQEEIVSLDSISSDSSTFFHDQFQARFLARVNIHPSQARDDWFVDNVYLGMPAPAIAVSFDTIQFDTTAANQTTIFELEVQNIGLTPYQVSGITVNGEAYTADPAGFTVAGGNKQIVPISFTPPAEEMYEGSLEILHDAPNAGPVTVILQGRGGALVGIEEATSSLPKEFAIAQNYPNPFNPETRIQYQLPRESEVSLRVFNLLGQTVKSLVNRRISAGYHESIWDGRDASGKPVASGVYIYHFKANAGDNTRFEKVRKMVLLR